MKAKLALLIFCFTMAVHLQAQKTCGTAAYLESQLQSDPSQAAVLHQLENSILPYITEQNRANQRTSSNAVIRIPVVVHILYNQPHENISDEQVMHQIETLNKSFRRQNADTANAPAHFASLAADCEIEFHLATSDPQRRSTNGIVRKYTPVKSWKADDKMKFSSEMGADGWDSKSYLNIWVCNLSRVAGYSTFPGGDPAKDGIVLGYSVFGTGGSGGFELGRTAVHEAGHWMNLKHLWGDEHCGDDGVDDTPKQSSYNTGCPATAKVSCGNGPYGDMFMNYMDFTNDACMNLFTKGQKARMRNLFLTGGPRHSILSSTGLNEPLILESPLPDEPPRWLQPHLFPNPALTEMTLDLSYDIRWLGKVISIFNQQGQVMMQFTVTSKVQQVNVGKLSSGMYYLAGKKDDGETIKQKFIKL